AVFIPALRRDQPEAQAVMSATARAHAAGVPVDWARVFGRAHHVELPTYPFQRQRYWLDAPAGSGDGAGLGLTGAGHPLLGAAVELADGPGIVFTGRLSTRTHPWLAEHAAGDTVLLPGTALVELALAVGQQVGRPRLAELTLEAPLVLPADAYTQLQVTVTPADGQHVIAVHSRPQPGRADP